MCLRGRGDHEPGQVPDGFQGPRFGGGDRGVDLGGDLPLEAGEVVVIEQTGAPQSLDQQVDGVPPPPDGDLLLGPVPLGVVHRVGAVPVGTELEEHGAPPGSDLGRGPLGGVDDREHVHAVDRPGRHPVAGGPQREVGDGLAALQGGAHGVQVVLAAEEHGQAPQRGQVHRLMELALGHRPLAEEAGGDARPVVHVIGQR
jgi:hypothetical protein